MSKIKRVSKADYLTMLNAMFGIVAIWYFQEREFLWGTTLLVIAMVFDGLDGYAARKWGSSHKIGTYLDSIADSISFALAPAIAVYAAFYDLNQPGSLTFQSPQNTFTVIASLSLAFAGISRLAKFTKSESNLTCFKGLATPIAAGMVVFMILMFGPSGYTGYYGIAYMPYLVLAGVLFIAVMELVPIRFPKVRGKVVIPFAIVLITCGFVAPVSYFLISPISHEFYVLLSRTGMSIALIIFTLYIIVCPVLLYTEKII